MYFKSSHILFQFSKILNTDPILLFASYPVGFPILKSLHSRFINMEVVTHFTSPNTKLKNEVELFCKKNNIVCYTPVKKSQSKQLRDQEWASFVKELKDKNKLFKLGIACAYGYMIPQILLNQIEKGMVLAHPSLIPKYRGGSPIFHAIANGQTQSGASFMEVSANQFDHGNLLHQIKSQIGEKDSYEKVQKQLSQLMANQIHYVIDNLDLIRPGKRQSQMDVTGIPAHQLLAKIHKQKKLDVNKPAQQVYNWSRALISPRVNFNEKEIIIFFDKVFLDDPENEYQAGELKLKGKSLYMKCSDRFLKIESWQQISKLPQPIHTFINRFIDKKNYKNEIKFK